MYFDVCKIETSLSFLYSVLYNPVKFLINISNRLKMSFEENSQTNKKLNRMVACIITEIKDVLVVIHQNYLFIFFQFITNFIICSRPRMTLIQHYPIIEILEFIYN